MKTSKLIKLLKSLTPNEHKKFYKFIRSPFFTSSKDLLKLFDYLRRYYPDFPPHLVEKERIFKLLFPGQSYSDVKLRNLMGKLSKLTESYLLYLETEQEVLTRRIQLKKIYSKRNLYDLFKRESDHLIEKTEEQGYKDSDYYKKLHSLNQDLYFHPQTDKQGDTVAIVKTALDNLMRYFAIAQSRLVCELKCRGEIFAEENHFELFDFESLDFENNILFRLLRQTINMFETNDIIVYKNLKANFIKNVAKLKQEDGRYLLSFLLNYTIRQTSKQETLFFKETFDLYKFGIKQSLLFYNNQLTSSTFLNIVVTGSKLKAFPWTKTFIDEYKSALDIKLKEEIVALAMAFWYFHKENYEEAIKSIEYHNFSQVLLQINTKTLLLRAYYERYQKNPTYFDSINDNCAAFEKYIRRRHVINKQRKDAYLNFVQFLRKLINTDKVSLRKQEVKKLLLSKLTSYEDIFARSWLEEKIQSQ